MFKSYKDMLEELEEEMQRVSEYVLKHALRLPGSSNEVWTPRVDIYETVDNLVVKVCASGADSGKMEVELSSDNRFLTVRGFRSQTDTERQELVRYYQLEVYYGEFERIIVLPTEVTFDRERLEAVYEDGVLLITLPKIRERKPRTVPISE